MNTRPFFFGTNVKMTQTPGESLRFLQDLRQSNAVSQGAQLFFIPPFTSLAGLPQLADQAGIWIGAQNMHHAEAGAFTGEISARMLTDLGVHLVMLGHAERRKLFGETDRALRRKVRAALDAGLRALLCVGEDAEEKSWRIEAEVIARQLKIALGDVRADECDRLMIAYEPVWSIGEGGLPATTDDVLPSARCIRETLSAIFGPSAEIVPLLYGGSVNVENCEAYARLDLIDGLFVGRAAWHVPGFVQVLTLGAAANRSRA